MWRFAVASTLCLMACDIKGVIDRDEEDDGSAWDDDAWGDETSGTGDGTTSGGSATGSSTGFGTDGTTSAGESTTGGGTSTGSESTGGTDASIDSGVMDTGRGGGTGIEDGTTDDGGSGGGGPETGGTGTGDATIGEMSIEIVWENSGDDMDLHLLAPDGEVLTDTDCHYANCTDSAFTEGLDWGVIGDSSDDPTLVLDDISGTGPEEIQIPSPEAGLFTVVVHDYPGSVYEPGNVVTINISLGGELVWSNTALMTGEDVYMEFATIESRTGTITEVFAEVEVEDTTTADTTTPSGDETSE